MKPGSCLNCKVLEKENAELRKSFVRLMDALVGKLDVDARLKREVKKLGTLIKSR